MDASHESSIISGRIETPITHRFTYKILRKGHRTSIAVGRVTANINAGKPKISGPLILLGFLVVDSNSLHSSTARISHHRNKH
jgi:hypothetical protein